MPNKTKRTWILVADGARALVVVNDGPGKGLKTVPGREIKIDLPPTREIGTGKPGRVQESVGGARHAIVPHADWHEQRKQDFARAVAKKMDADAARGRFDRLILVAPPAALGNIRAALKPATRKLVAAEINKDLTHLPVDQLGSHLADVMI
ncbi:MAG: host attachment protein [Alphaproteobacteria bacterium]|nr:host attachment protein [Alphaproteobacteria bacterium]